jgi:hypothetical protein
MVGTQLGVNLVAGLPVRILLRGDRFVTAGIHRQLLLDDVGLDGDAQVIGLAGEVGREVVVLVLFECRVAQVAPQDRRHPEIMRHFESLADLDDLPCGLCDPK